MTGSPRWSEGSLASAVSDWDFDSSDCGDEAQRSPPDAKDLPRSHPVEDSPEQVAEVAAHAAPCEQPSVASPVQAPIPRLVQCQSQEQNHCPDAPSPKIEALERVLETIDIRSRASGLPSKLLLASERLASFEAAAPSLQRHGHKYVVYGAGGAGGREGVMEYLTGGASALCLDMGLHATGLNLQVTTDLIFLHAPPSPSVYRQVVGRAQRIGRTAPLTVWLLLHGNELKHLPLLLI